MRILIVLRVRITVLLASFFVLSLPVFSQVGSDPFESMTLSLVDNSIHLACPDDPLLFSVDNVEPVDQPATERYTFFWSTSADSITWKPVGNYQNSFTYSQNMTNAPFYIKVDASYYSMDPQPKFTKSLGMKISLAPNCKQNVCRQTTTGDYFNGTDFDREDSLNTTIDWNSVPPGNLKQYFSDQGIVFKAKSGAIMNQNELGYSLYIDDSLNVNPHNHFFVKEGNVNESFFSITFPNSLYRGKTYRFTMRFYLIVPKTCTTWDPNASIMSRTGHGTATTDMMDVDVYKEYKVGDQTRSTLITSHFEAKGSDVARYKFYSDVQSYITAGEDNIFRIEMVYYGLMPADVTANYTFEPYFEQFPTCATVAVDYISAEAASVCVSPRSACVGNEILVKAAGFPRNANYQWIKYTNSTYSTVEPWSEYVPGVPEVTYNLDQFNQKHEAKVVMMKPGVFYYSVTDGKDTIKFSLVGTECGNSVCPDIKGDSNICVPQFPYSLNYQLENENVLDWLGQFGVDYTYVWDLVAPNGLKSDRTKVYLDEAVDHKTAAIRVEQGALMSDSFPTDQSYKLVLSAYKLISGQLNAFPECTDTMTLWVYDQPNISSMKLTTQQGYDSICAAMASDTILINNADAVKGKGYIWNWTGATMGTDSSFVNINDFNKGSLCDASVNNYPIKLEIVNGVCKATLNDTFYVHTPDAPEMYCDDLSEDTIYHLSPSSLDTIINLPIPNFKTSCDENPKLTINMHYVAKETAHSLDSIITLAASDLINPLDGSYKKIPFQAHAGDLYLNYTLTDGCGKTDKCDVSVEIKDTTKPFINCDLINDHTVKISTQKGCQAVPGDSDVFKIMEPPILPDENFKDTVILITGVYEGRTNVTPPSMTVVDPGVDISKYTKENDLNDPYDIGTTFILWSFTDPSGNVTYCHNKVVVLNDRPVFICDSLLAIRSSVNKNPQREYAYASAQPQGTRNPDTEYVLENVLKIPTVSDLQCDKAAIVLTIKYTGEYVDEDGNVLGTVTDSIISGDELLKHRFPIGVTDLTYEFDDHNDTLKNVLCTQKVVIASMYSPTPLNCPENVTLYAGDDCYAIWDLPLDDVPVASIPYFKEVKYLYDNCDGRSYNYDDLGMSTALSKNYDTIGYPFMVRRISELDANWNTTPASVVTEFKSEFTDQDSVAIKEIHHRRDDKSVCKTDHHEKMALKVTNFNKLPECVTTPFRKGYYKVIWYYDNGKGILDSCVSKITVEDTIPPTLNCGSWGETDSFYVDESCLVPASIVDIHIPNSDSLGAIDNCTDPDKLTITWTRTHETTPISSLDDSYALGNTYIVWTATDESGNSSFCTQTISVFDTLPPFFDCSTLKTIVDTADANCETSAQSLIEKGKLYVPQTDEDDPCSPTGGVIKGIGKRSDGKRVMEDPYPLDTTYITWTFKDAAGNSDSCVQMVVIEDVTPPFFADCDGLDDIIIELAPDSCVASQDLVRKRLGNHIAHDNCSGDIEGVPYLTLADSSYVELPEAFKKDTTYLISWIFRDKKNNEDTCYQNVIIRDTTFDLGGICPQEKIKNIGAKVQCSVSYEDLMLPTLTVNDPCDGILLPFITAWVMQKDSSIKIYHNEELESAEYPIGTHRFSWVFTDKEMNQDSCVMTINVKDSLDLIMTYCDTDKDKVIVLNPGQCSLDPDSLSKYITIPIAYDLCDEDTIIPIIERRFNGELVVDENGNPIIWDSQDFPLGTTDIKWIFIDKLGVMKDSCEKSITVKTELFDCTVLQDTIEVNLLENLYATAAEVEAAGLKEPEITIDKCNAAEVSFMRSDNLGRADNYEIGVTDVNWTFTYVFGDVVTCHQHVLINDMVPPFLKCPDLPNVTYECYGELPAPYMSFEEFKAAGGSISDERKFKEWLGYEDDTLGDNYCNYTLLRIYRIKDVRDKVIECSQEFNINDTKAPYFLTQLDTLVFSCDDEIPGIETVTVEAEDNCSDKADIKITSKVTNNRAVDTHSCAYNSYTLWREWTAVDKCGNESAPLVQVVIIVDTLAPKLILPQDWQDTVVAENIKNCEWVMPKLDDLLKGHVEDACTFEDDIEIWQVPAAGTPLTKTTDVYIYVSDNCGNKDSVKVVAFMDKLYNVVSLEAYSKTLCGSDSSAISLWSQEIRFARGFVTLDLGGEMVPIPSVFNYDCYRDTISEATLVYSNNPRTYYSRFYDANKEVRDSIFNSKVKIRKKSQSGLYYFVVMDTITQCSDTAKAYLTIFERPRISLASNELHHCDNDTFDLQDLLLDSKACVNDMGSEITKNGWYVDDKEYKPGTPVMYDGKLHSMYYYADNSCGRSTSYDSYFTYCGPLLLTKEDSIKVVGSEANLNLWRKDELHSEDSVKLTIHQRYVTDSILLATNPSHINRVWMGDELEFRLNTTYKPAFYHWYKISGLFDGRFPASFDKYGDVLDSLNRTDGLDELLIGNMSGEANKFRFIPTDSALYYVLIGDGVCPAMPSNVVSVDVMDKLPTAITPFNSVGLNDVFLKGRDVIIFDRYGNRVYEGTDGWDGTTKGGVADPGVYFYDAVINGRNYKGTIEVVYFK
ncbi:MAG TPA: hypothetical protein PKW49_10335 [Paludibacteraceae bacterium]|nr:hypothetical protein [Paludibacteraceae bacterium]